MCVCIVFGGTKGIGASIAGRLFNDGFHVAVVSRNKDNVSEFIDRFGALSLAAKDTTKLIGMTCDITDETKVTATMREITNMLGPVNVLVNAAGIAQNQLLIKSSADDIWQLLNVNLVGSMLTCKAALRGMIQRRSGCIINVGSVVGSKGNPGQCTYGASKAGLEGFTKSLAKEVSPRGIRVNCINPGYIMTDMTAGLEQTGKLLETIPLGRMGDPREVASLVRFLIDATYITGQILFVDGGLQISS